LKLFTHTLSKETHNLDLQAFEIGLLKF